MRVVIVDDDSFFRSGLRALLEGDGVEVVADWRSAEEALEGLDRAAPDVVAVGGPTACDLDSARRIAERASGPKLLVLSDAVDAEDAAAYVAAGAAGCLTKEASEGELVAAVRAVAAGAAVFSPSIARSLAALGRVERDDPGLERELSDRERDVLRLVAEGKDNGEIARDLFISGQTVKNHISSILSKLGVENRIQAAVYAVRAKLV